MKPGPPSTSIALAVAMLPLFCAGPARAQLTVTTDPATDISATNATLNGVVDDDRGLTASCVTRFEWGLTTAYGQRTPNVVHGFFPQPPITWPLSIRTALTGLQPDTLYHYRAVAINNIAPLPPPVYGPDRTFTTVACPTASVRIAGFSHWRRTRLDSGPR